MDFFGKKLYNKMINLFRECCIMKNMKKTLCVILAVMLIAGMASAAFAAGTGYTISNPYENIDWDNINAYKTALHTHTNASDGTPTLKESIGRHAETGYDIVATTDHGTVNRTWAENNENALIHGALSLVGKSEGELEYLGTEGSFANGTTYTLVTENGDDYVKTSDDRTVMRLPYGIENNAVSANAHVNSWFADYSNNFLTTYFDAVSCVDKKGGVSVINHPGEYTKARYEIHSDKAYDENNLSYGYYINKFAWLLENYDSCIGIDMNSKSDNRTRFDRILWDNLLARFSANGENVYGICSSDAHQLSVIDTGFTYLLMPELTSSAARKALENGEFFGASHCLGNPEELYDIAAALKEFYGETDLYSAVKKAYIDMQAKIAAIDNGEEDADEDIGITYEVLDRDGYCTAATQPMITAITVDDEADTIKIDTENALIVRFVSDGKLICTLKADGSEFRLADYSGKLGDYVRAEVFGEGGIVYTQAFLLNSEEKAGTSKVIKGLYVDFGILDCLLAIFNNWSEIISRFFSTIGK